MATKQRSSYAPPAPPMPFEGLNDKGYGILLLISLLDLVPLRTDIGLGLLKITYLAGIVVLSFVFTWLGNLHLSLSLFGGLGVRTDDDMSLLIYIFFVFVPRFIWQRVQRLREEKYGVEPHNYSFGNGRWYGFIPLPDKYLDMVVDPLVSFIVGGLLRYRLGCGLLGLAVMVSAVALAAVEKMRYARALQHKRDRRDIEKEAANDADEMQNRPRGRQSAVTAATIPTGNDDELRAVIEKRKSENSWDREGENNDVR